MRGIALIAFQRGYSQERLATAFSRCAGRSITGANVARHFASANPKPETVEAYCGALDIADDVRAAILGEAPTLEQVTKWREHLRMWFAVNAATFEKDALARVETALDLLEEARRDRALAAFEFAIRHETNIGKPSDSEPFIALANALAPVLDLRALVPEVAPGQEVLSDVYSALRSHFDHETAIALVGVVAAAIPVRFSQPETYGSVQAMWAHLDRQLANSRSALNLMREDKK
jgi:hypothetical protein